MQTSQPELNSYAHSLRYCTSNFFLEHAQAGKQNDSIIPVLPTMRNILSTMNFMETWLEKRHQDGQMRLKSLLEYLNSGTIFDALVLFTPQFRDGAFIQSSDFKDKRTVPEGYTLDQYLREKLPLLSQLIPQLRSTAVQDEQIRPVLIERVSRERDEISNSLTEISDAYGDLAAKVELPVFENLLERLSQRNTSAPDISGK